MFGLTNLPRGTPSAVLHVTVLTRCEEVLRKYKMRWSGNLDGTLGEGGATGQFVRFVDQF